MIRLFLALHWIGVLLVLGGLYLWLYGDARQGDMNGMLWTAVLLGTGGLLISPYPIVKAFQWMAKSSEAGE
ncbi:MAG: hypothetical protein ACWA44_06135 [Thiotrichales bacterium]